jgi:hypothetical protein
VLSKADVALILFSGLNTLYGVVRLLPRIKVKNKKIKIRFLPLGMVRPPPKLALGVAYIFF